MKIIALATVTLFFTGLATSSAYSGQCPPGQEGSAIDDSAPTENYLVETEELDAIDLGKEKVNIPNHNLRMRTITVQPGGHVLLHGHENRPALALVTEGEFVEYSNECGVPVIHKLGEVINENSNVQHWVKNNGDTPAVLTVTDIVDLTDIQQGNFK
ncbi:cupin domain-containing protein [Pseudovibrio sp. JE062]|uniref:cupin domain-containing protein n=1 Tax=Pseudovibrio sp. JE062 TaxID=439495 RepID=UPI000305D686|nr:cupin domain-containing protein [Pseudovibrio sp. JE062]